MAIGMGFLLVALVLVSLVAYIVFAGAPAYGEVVIVAVVVVLVAFAGYIIWDRARSVSKGLPAADERLKNVNYRAGYYGFIAAIWSAVFAPVLADMLFGHELEGDLATAVVVIVAGFTFAVSYLYLARKGH
jgi:hypothetical protein